MKATSVSILLSVLAIGAVAILYFKVDELGERLATVRAGRAVQDDASAPDDPRYIVSGSSPAELGDARRTARSLGYTASKLDNADDLDALREENALLKPQVQKKDESAPRWLRRRPLRSVDDLATRLSLAPSQKDRVKVAIERGKGRIEEILSIPGEDGKSPKEARLEQQKKILEALSNPGKNGQNVFTMAMSARRRLGEKIPGRNETYREGIERVKKETREEVAQNLTAEQNAQFKDTPIDPLIGSSGGNSVSIATSFGGDGSGRVGGIIVSDEIVIDSAGDDPVPARSARATPEASEEKDGQ